MAKIAKKQSLINGMSRPLWIFILTLSSVLASYASTVVVSISPIDQTIAVGDTATFSLFADIPDPAVGWGLTVGWDTSLLQLVNYSIGPLWLPAGSADGHTLSGVAFPDSISGLGVLLAEVQLQGISPGNSSLALNYDPSDASQGFALEDFSFADLQFNNGTLTVTSGAAAPETAGSYATAAALAALALAAWFRKSSRVIV